MTEINAKYRIPDSVVFQDLNGETVLLNLEGESYFGLDTIGSDIWRLLAEGVSPQAIPERLADAYAGSGEEIARDVEAFIQQLVSHGLLAEAD